MSNKIEKEVKTFFTNLPIVHYLLILRSLQIRYHLPFRPRRIELLIHTLRVQYRALFPAKNIEYLVENCTHGFGS
jgi:hypothetical protein